MIENKSLKRYNHDGEKDLEQWLWDSEKPNNKVWVRPAGFQCQAFTVSWLVHYRNQEALPVSYVYWRGTEILPNNTILKPMPRAFYQTALIMLDLIKHLNSGTCRNFQVEQQAWSADVWCTNFPSGSPGSRHTHLDSLHQWRSCFRKWGNVKQKRQWQKCLQMHNWTKRYSTLRLENSAKLKAKEAIKWSHTEIRSKWQIDQLFWNLSRKEKPEANGCRTQMNSE